MRGKGSGGQNRLSPQEHQRRGTWRADRHGDRNGSTGDPRPPLHSYRGHCLVVSDLPDAVGRAVIYALRNDETLTWDDMPALIARLMQG